jgi:hypothetical protein
MGKEDELLPSMSLSIFQPIFHRQRICLLFAGIRDTMVVWEIAGSVDRTVVAGRRKRVRVPCKTAFG